MHEIWGKQINLLLFPLKTSENDSNHLNSFKIQSKFDAAIIQYHLTDSLFLFASMKDL